MASQVQAGNKRLTRHFDVQIHVRDAPVDPVQVAPVAVDPTLPGGVVEVERHAVSATPTPGLARAHRARCFVSSSARSVAVLVLVK